MFRIIHGLIKYILGIIFSIICLGLSTLTYGYTILFVHLGNDLPTYLACATHQARLFNPQADIVVIADCQAIEQASFDEFLPDKIRFIRCQDLWASDVHKAFVQKTSLDKGFWRKCTERFYYIEEFMRQCGIRDLFHLEYDNMLYVNLQELLPVFHQYPNIAATFDNDNRCIPGFIYFAQDKAIKKLVTHITEMCQSGLNDMEVIASYRKRFGEEEIGTLPIIVPAYTKEQILRTPSGFSTASPEIYTAHFEDFNSIFDAAALGQYLGGIDPRNGKSVPGFINESCVFNPALLQYEWILDEKGRRVPYMIYSGKEYRINNLHIHSKRLKDFES